MCVSACAFCPPSRAVWVTRTPRALPIRPSLCAISPCHAFPGAPFRLDPAGCGSFQPAAELPNLQRHRNVRHVRGALLRLRLLPTMDLPCTLGHAMLLALEARRQILTLPSLRVVLLPISCFRARRLCPTRTSCSSVVPSARAMRPSPLLATATQVGLKEAARRPRLRHRRCRRRRHRRRRRRALRRPRPPRHR